MKTLEDFYPWVAPAVPSCPSVLLDQAIRDAAIRLCEQSWAWQQELDDLEVTTGEREYAFDMPSTSAEPVGIVWIRRGTRDFSGYTYMPNFFLLDAEPTEDFALSAKMALKPTATAERIEDFLFRDWRRVIAAGAKAYLLGMPNQSWDVDQIQEAKAEADFVSGIAMARAKVNKQASAASMTVAPRRFI